MTRVLVVDDHPIVREGIKITLANVPDISVVGEAKDGSEVIQEIRHLHPDVVLMDIQMPYSGLRATIDIMKHFPEAKVLMLTISDNEDDLFKAVKAGARGYLLKGTGLEDLVAAVRSVANGGAIFTPVMAGKLIKEFRISSRKNSFEPILSQRELDVLILVADGASNKEIATQLFISEPTVKTYLRNILSKLHLKNRSQAAVYAAEHNMLHNKREGNTSRE